MRIQYSRLKNLQWRRSVIKLGGSRPKATSLPLSILLSSLPSRVFSEGLDRARAHPLPNILIQFMQSNSLIKSTLMSCTTRYRNQHACMQSSATVGRTDTIYYRPCIAAWHQKVGVCVHLDSHCQKVVGHSGPLDLHGIAAIEKLGS